MAEIEGMSTVLGNLERAVVVMAGPAADATTDIVVARAVESARSHAPVLTGKLQASIHAEGEGAMREVVADAPYAAFVEYGTSNMSAQPFFRPALHEAEAELPRTAEQVYRHMVPGLTAT